MFKLKRDEKGIALLDTKWERIKITLDIVIGFPLMIIIAVSFIWLPFWIITNKNIFSYFF
jgi:hypothetical protein